MENRVLTSSAEETIAAGTTLAATLKQGDIVALFGSLGSGKTTFIKGAISALSAFPPEEITSPTFSFLHLFECHENSLPIYHFDFYRLKSLEEFEKAGFDEYLQGEGICFLEWAERIQSKLPKKSIHIKIDLQGDLNQRVILIQR